MTSVEFYREASFKETLMGKIPKDWKFAFLDEVSDEIRTGPFGSQLKKIELSKSGVKVYTQENVLKRNFSAGNLRISKAKFEKLKKMEVKPGDVLITIRGTTGTSAVFPEDAEKGIIHTNLAIIRTKKGLLSPEYLSFLINDFSLIKFQIRGLSSATTLGALYAKQIRKIKIPLPPVSEQKKIVEILSTVDKAIQKTDEIIAKIERLKKGLIQELLTKGINLFALEKEKILRCVRKCFENRDHEFGREENLNHHLAKYLKNEFSEYDVDVEVEKKHRRRPDIVIHKRHTDQNLFAIEVKKDWNLREIIEDVRKLEEVMLGGYNYCEAIFIGFNVENFDSVFRLSNRINFILVNSKGEIKLRIRKREFKETRIGRIPKEWKVVRLGDIITYKKGRKPVVLFDKKEPNTLPYLTADNLRTGIFTQWAREEDDVVKVNEDDLLLIWDGFYCGDSFTGFKGILSSTMIKIEPKKPNLDKRYLYYFLKTRFKILNSQIAGMYLKHVSKFVFESLRVPLPSLAEQRKIAEILSSVDKRLKIERNEKEKLERIKQALMDLLLTGKIRVKVA